MTGPRPEGGGTASGAGVEAGSRGRGHDPGREEDMTTGAADATSLHLTRLFLPSETQNLIAEVFHVIHHL